MKKNHLAASPRVALITGASKGLGFAISKKLNAQNYFIILAARNLNDLKAAKRKLPNEKHSAVLAADVSQKNFGAALAQLLKKENISHLDLVIHSAGINHMGTIQETKPENAEATFRVNAYSVIRLAHATRALLEKGFRPRFILVSSLMQYFAMPGRSVYAASKATAEQFTGAWGHELKAEGSPVRVQIFRPAGIETGFHANTVTDGESPRSDISRMSADSVAEHLYAFIRSNRYETGPGLMNKVVAFVGRHFPAFTRYLVARRYRLRQGRIPES